MVKTLMRLTTNSTSFTQDTPYFIHTNSTPDGALLLSTAHTRLVGVLNGMNYNLSANTTDNLPTQVLSCPRYSAM